MKIRLAILLFCLLGCAANAQVTAGSVHCGRLLDVRSGRVLANQLVVFDNTGVITSVGAAGRSLTAEHPSGLKGALVCPGKSD